MPLTEAEQIEADALCAEYDALHDCDDWTDEDSAKAEAIEQRVKLITGSPTD